MEQVFAVLMEFISTSDGVVVIREFMHMSINECLELARFVNSTEPNHILMCAPDLSNNPLDM